MTAECGSTYGSFSFSCRHGVGFSSAVRDVHGVHGVGSLSLDPKERFPSFNQRESRQK